MTRVTGWAVATDVFGSPGVSFVAVPESANAMAMSSRSPKNVTLAASKSDVPTDAGDAITSYGVPTAFAGPG